MYLYNEGRRTKYCLPGAVVVVVVVGVVVVVVVVEVVVVDVVVTPIGGPLSTQNPPQSDWALHSAKQSLIAPKSEHI